MPANYIFVADIRIHDKETNCIGVQEYKYFSKKFGGEHEVMFGKIGRQYIPLYPSSGIPSNTIVLSENVASELGVEEANNRSVFITDPDFIDYMAH